MAALTTSEHTGFILGLSDQLAQGSSSAAVDTGAVRDSIVNNLNHLTDCAGQQLVQFVAPTTAYSQTAPDTSLYTRFDTLPTFRVWLRQRHDGQSYRVVITARVSISAAGTASFRFYLRPPTVAYSPPPDPTTGSTLVYQDTTTSTTGADLGPGSVYATSTVMSAVLGSPFVDTVETLIGDGGLSSAVAVPFTLEVWAKSTVGTSLPQIQSLTAHEYIGKA